MSFANRRADRIRIAIGEHERVSAAQLPKVVQIGIRDERLTVLRRETRRLRVEVQPAGPEVAPLDCVEEIDVTIEARPQTRPVWKVRVRGDNETIPCSSQRRQILKRVNLIGGCREVQQHHVAPVDRPLDPWHQHDSTLARIRNQRWIAQIAIVKRQREGVESELSCFVDQLVGVVVDHVDRILRTVEVEVYFQHVQCLI